MKNLNLKESNVNEMDNNTLSYDETIMDDSFCKSFDEILYNDFESKLENFEQIDEEDEIDSDLENVDLNGLPVPLEQAAMDYKNGELEAFDYIYSHYKPKLERLSYRQKDEDLVQELSIVLLNAVQTFDINGNAKFNTYFWKCARNHMGTLNIRKSAKKRTCSQGVISMQQSFSSNETEVEYGTFIEDKVSTQCYQDSLFNIILEENIFPFLKSSEITAIKLLLQGYTLEEIGKQLGGITAPAVHVKLKRLSNKKEVGKQLRELYNAM